MSVFSRLAFILSLPAVLLVAGCCSNCGNPPPEPEPGPVDTATVSGRVVKGDNPSVALPNSLVTLSTDQTATTDSSGDFLIEDVPVGSGAIDLTVETISNPNYSNQTVADIGITKGQTINITVAVVPIALGLPFSIGISPGQATVDLYGEIQFSAPINGPSGRMEVQPSWYLADDIGTIDSNGKFIALKQGVGTVVATSGYISAQAYVTVTPSRGPQITTVLVDPLSLGASGGTVTVTAAANDGDGLLIVRAEMVDPLANETYHYMALVDGTSYKDGTWRVNINIDPNDVRKTQEDATRPLAYDIRVYAMDYAGNDYESDFYRVTVAGVDEPGSPPPL